jgi:NitT/TauT family transport system permease protein
MLLTQYNQSMELGSEFAVILLLGVIGFLMNHAVKLAERRFCFWAHRNGNLGQQ